jgi:glutathione S-transferase
LLKFADKQDKFGFQNDLERNQCLQWTFFWHGSGAPYQGQVHHFSRAAPEKLPYAITRFRNEVLRVFGVLEIHLSGKYTGEQKEYLAGNGAGRYSVADIKVRSSAFEGTRNGLAFGDRSFVRFLRPPVEKMLTVVRFCV